MSGLRLWLRPWADWALATKTLVVVAIPVAPLLISTLLFYLADRREREAELLTARAIETYGELYATQMLVVDAETATRGFLLTGDRAFLAPYTHAVALLPRQFARLDELTIDSTVRTQLETFEQAVNERLSVLQSVTASSRKPGDPLLLEQLREGKQRMEHARRLMSEMVLIEQRLISERRARVEYFQRTTLTVVVAGAVLGMIGGAGAAVLLSRTVVRRVQHVQQNAELLASSRPLRPGPHGNDEVGALGRGVHEAAALLRARDMQLQRQMEQLTAANNELEAFSYSVSHDLRAPLRHIGGFAALLEKGAATQLDAPHRRYVRIIVDAAARMGRLVDELLAFSRMGRTEMLHSDVDLDAVIADIVGEETRSQPGREIVWKRHRLPMVAGDPAMLRVALSNLISNAVKYTATQPRAEIEIGTVQPANGEHVLFVRDNGVGFDMQYADKLFGVFQRLHSAEEFEGTGIGLAIVRRVVQRHGGRTWAEGAVNGGAIFYLSLPVARLPA